MTTKKQHYVPRFLLKNFSCDETGKTINTYLINQNKIVNSIGLKNQAYSHYLYGPDQILENYFGLFESSSASIINELSGGHVNLANEEIDLVKLFIVLQKHRTPYSSALLNGQMDSFFKEVYKKEPMVRNHIDDFKIRYTDPYKFLFSLAIELSPALDDLQIGLLNSGGNNSFIIGEHPVVILNPYLSVLQNERSS